VPLAKKNLSHIYAHVQFLLTMQEKFVFCVSVRLVITWRKFDAIDNCFAALDAVWQQKKSCTQIALSI